MEPAEERQGDDFPGDGALRRHRCLLAEPLVRACAVGDDALEVPVVEHEESPIGARNRSGGRAAGTAAHSTATANSGPSPNSIAQRSGCWRTSWASASMTARKGQPCQRDKAYKSPMSARGCVGGLGRRAFKTVCFDGHGEKGSARTLTPRRKACCS
jgi:hypothetical protein